LASGLAEDVLHSRGGKASKSQGPAFDFPRFYKK